MSQNGPYSGPPWSNGSSDEPYAEPADPWGDHGAPVQEPAWGAHPPSIPQQPVHFTSGSLGAPVSPVGPDWGQSPPPLPPARRNTPIVALVVTLGVLICVGLGATAWLLKERGDNQGNQASPNPSSSAAEPGPAPRGSEDARFYVKEGDCVVNEGSDDLPDMRTTACTSGTYEVLKQVMGKTAGEKDAEKKCSSVSGYTKWYFYDSPFDDLDFVLCLKEHRAS
jgi:hypothetical protein